MFCFASRKAVVAYVTFLFRYVEGKRVTRHYTYSIKTSNLQCTSIQLMIPLHSAAVFPPLVECVAVNSTVGGLL